MKTAKEHYDQQLAAIYSWMGGTPEMAIQRHRELFSQLQLESSLGGLAVDLGAGSGFQSIPLAELGFSVVALDFCEALLTELSDRTEHLSIRTILDDLQNFPQYIEEPAQLIVCMGDTLTHLESLSAVESLLGKVEGALAPGGKLILSFRDYFSRELQGTARFIPVRSDESTILTCFLEYHADIVEVYDLLYRQEGNGWVLQSSSYPKLRLSKDWLVEQLQKLQLEVIRDEISNGMIYLIAQKN